MNPCLGLNYLRGLPLHLNKLPWRRQAGQSTTAKLPVGSGTSSRYMIVVCIDGCTIQGDR